MSEKRISKLRELKNIGPTLAKRLNDIGVYTLAELHEKGPSNAFLEIKDQNPDKTIPVCYYLYSFEGAILNVYWDDIPDERKKELLKGIGR